VDRSEIKLVSLPRSSLLPASLLGRKHPLRLMRRRLQQLQEQRRAGASRRNKIRKTRRAFASLGLVLLEGGQVRRSGCCLPEALTLNPRLPGIDLHWGLAEFKQGHLSGSDREPLTRALSSTQAAYKPGRYWGSVATVLSDHRGLQASGGGREIGPREHRTFAKSWHRAACCEKSIPARGTSSVKSWNKARTQRPHTCSWAKLWTTGTDLGSGCGI